jgi:hypothetical protein
MRRGAACAVWVVVLSCAPGGEGTDSVVEPNRSDTPGGGGASTGGSGGLVTGGGPGGIFGDGVGCVNGCAFGPDPILEAGVTAGDIGAFTASSEFQSGALCVLEPQLSTADGKLGALFPRNWLRPRFRWTSSGGETLWEIRLENETQPDPLRVYTRESEWTIPAEVWERMGPIETPINVTIRGLGAGGALTGTKGSFQIAPVDAGGSMVFWATTSSLVTQQSSRLVGFSIGDEGVVPTLSAVDVKTGNIPGEDGALARGYYACGGDTPRPTCDAEPANPACCVPTGFEFGQVECVGCHVSTPDGKAVLFTDNWPWNKVAASIEPGTTGALPATITPFAANLMKQPWLGMQALSPAHFNPEPGGERILITSYGTRPNPATQPFSSAQPTTHQLAWFNLAAEDPTPLTPVPEIFPEENPYGEVLNQRQTEIGAAFGTGFGLLTTIGENRNAVTPTWSNDGAEIAYVSTDISSTDGHPDWTANIADIRVVPYGAQPGAISVPPAGGASVPLAGASDPSFLEYYPEYSADDAFVAFTRAPNPSLTTRCVPRQDANGVVTPCAPQNLGENPDGPYYNRNGEIYIVPRGGASEPIRLAANDPVSCSGETSRGIINSWPKWSPGSRRADNTVGPHEANGKKYYFLIFSSARQYPGSFELQKARLTPEISNKSSQLYMASIMVDESGAITTYPAVYLWNQNVVVDPVAGTSSIQNASNLTPAWDDFSIPEVPPVFEPPR